HFGIHVPVTSYFEHNKLVKGPAILRTLQEGTSVALVTDAGTPGISDPGFLLVREARAAGIPVGPVPGPSAVVTPLSPPPSPARPPGGGGPPDRGPRRRSLGLRRVPAREAGQARAPAGSAPPSRDDHRLLRVSPSRARFAGGHRSGVRPDRDRGGARADQAVR